MGRGKGIDGIMETIVATVKALHFDSFSLIAQKQTANVPLNAIVIHKCLSFYEQNLSLQVSSESYKRWIGLLLILQRLINILLEMLICEIRKWKYQNMVSFSAVPFEKEDFICLFKKNHHFTSLESSFEAELYIAVDSSLIVTNIEGSQYILKGWQYGMNLHVPSGSWWSVWSFQSWPTWDELLKPWAWRPYLPVLVLQRRRRQTWFIMREYNYI